MEKQELKSAWKKQNLYTLDETTYKNWLPGRLDFRRLPGPVFDPRGEWLWAHFPEQRLVIEPNYLAAIPLESWREIS